MGWVANVWLKELYLLTTASPTVKKVCVGQTQLCLGKIGKILIFWSKPLFLLSKLIITLLCCSFSFWFFSFFLLIYIYKSNEKFIKLSKKCHPIIQKGYASDKYNQICKLQASIKVLGLELSFQNPQSSGYFFSAKFATLNNDIHLSNLLWVETTKSLCRNILSQDKDGP